MCRICTKCGNHEIVTSGVENADHSEGQYANEVLLLGPIQLENKNYKATHVLKLTSNFSKGSFRLRLCSHYGRIHRDVSVYIFVH